MPSHPDLKLRQAYRSFLFPSKYRQAPEWEKMKHTAFLHLHSPRSLVPSWVRCSFSIRRWVVSPPLQMRGGEKKWWMPGRREMTTMHPHKSAHWRPACQCWQWEHTALRLQGVSCGLCQQLPTRTSLPWEPQYTAPSIKFLLTQKDGNTTQWCSH